MTRCVITCLEPGCTRQINYESTDVEVPLYCCVHRTEEGRHSETRIVNRKPISKPLINKVELVCINRECRRKLVISRQDWMDSAYGRSCPECHRMMVYHKDVT
jgi:hypothetical protein